MLTCDFFGTVLPEKGTYVLFVQKPDGKGWNENHNSIESLTDAALGYDKTDATVYFALGTFVDNVEEDGTGRLRARRKAVYADKFKTLAVDIDVGGKYEDAREAAKDLLRACAEVDLPKPLFVKSGKGIHAYWPMTSAISARHWELMARMLRAALAACSVDFDTSKIHDPAMVLRPVGTRHKKDPTNWLEVTAAKPVELVDPRTLATALKPYKDLANTTPLQRKERRSSVLDAFNEGNRTPVVLESLKGCAQISALLESQGAKDALGNTPQEPMWRASLGIAKYAEDVDAAIIALAGGHEDFDFADSKRKLEGWQGTGPTTCQKFDELCPNVCAVCPHFGKIKSPAVLTQGHTELVSEDPKTGATVATELPFGYHIKDNHLYFRPKDSNEDTFVAPYALWVVGRVADVEESQQKAKVAVNLPIEGTKVVDIDVTAIADGGQTLSKALSLKQIYVSGDTTRLKSYLMTYLRELQKASSIDHFYRHFGWQKDGSFLSGRGVHGRDDVDHIHLEGAASEFQEFLAPTGDVSKWVKATKLFAHKDLKYHGGYFLMMLGAPLQAGSNIAGMFVNAYSRDSGSGKTLTARFGLSAWGKPSKLIRTVNDTDNSLYKSFGITSSFGAYIDEYTTVDVERGRKQIFTWQEGRERTRLSRSADGFREQAYWNMPIFASSNRDIHEMLNMRISSEAEQLRVLQLPFPRTKIFEDNADFGYRLTGLLEDNYGLIGPMLVDEIIKRGGAKEVYERAYIRFADKYQFKFLGQERFINSVIVCADAIGEIATDLGLIEFDYKKAVDNVLHAVRRQRETMRETKLDSLDVVFQFLTENADKIVHWREDHDGGGATRAYALPAPKVAVARTEYAYDKDGKLIGGGLYINRTTFRNWCALNGAEYRSAREGLEDMGIGVSEPRKTLFKGVSGAASSGQTYCVAIEVQSHPRLIEAAESTQPGAISCKPRLAVV